MTFVHRHKLKTWLVPATLLAVGAAAQLFAHISHGSIGILFYLPVFATAMIAFEVQSRPTWKTALARRCATLPALAAVLVGMAATSTPFTVSLPLFGFFFICVSCGNDMGGLLRGRGALVLGECSFGIYLLHGILLDILFVDLGFQDERLRLEALPLLLPFAAAATVLVTSATYVLIERPAMRLGKSLSKRLTGHRTTLDSRELEVAP